MQKLVKGKRYNSTLAKESVEINTDHFSTTIQEESMEVEIQPYPITGLVLHVTKKGNFFAVTKIAGEEKDLIPLSPEVVKQVLEADGIEEWLNNYFP